ncbi:hypothetical protein BE20_35325 [Sorangium cellulosum]|nr:hypothetical protein BE20_35325 [Sorangium cellulosum]
MGPRCAPSCGGGTPASGADGSTRAGSAAAARASQRVTRKPSDARSGAANAPTCPAPITTTCTAGSIGSMRTSTEPPQHMPRLGPSRKVSSFGVVASSSSARPMIPSAARSTAPPPIVPIAVRSSNRQSFCPGVDGADPCRATTEASTTRRPASSAPSAARSTSCGSAVRGMTWLRSGMVEL